MNLDDMILVSIDDHVIEPPDMFVNHVPEKYRDQAPVLKRSSKGIDYWSFAGQTTSTPFGLAATVGWPTEEWGFEPGSLSELRPGCFDIHERVRDMDANGVLASMNFPTMAGFSGRTFNEVDDRDLGLMMLRAYNDWMLDEWCATYPDRFIPLGIIPMWDPELAAEEIHRIGKKGCRSITFPETPHILGLPSFMSGHWDPVFKAMCEENMVLSLHIGIGFNVINAPEEASTEHLMVLSTQIAAISAQDLLFGPLRKFPELKVAMSEGGIGWVPFYLERVDRFWEHQSWVHGAKDFAPGGKMPSDVFREQFLCCYITDAAGLEMRHLVGMDNIAWECDYPHTDTTWPESPEYAWKQFQDAGCTKPEIDQITFENACRFFDWDPFARTKREDATVGALRARARDVDVTRMSRAEWKQKNEAAGIGVID